jgi:transcriptional regulator with XRE-family HTH domain
MEPNALSPNQLVALNLQRLRKQRGWTQEKAAEELEPHLGERWSRATFSAAERSIAGDRIRQFTADDLVAFAATFDQPIAALFLPPEDLEEVRVPGAAAGVSAEELAGTMLIPAAPRSSAIDLRAEARYCEKRAELYEAGRQPPPENLLAGLESLAAGLRNPAAQAMKERARAEVLIEQAQRLESRSSKSGGGSR